MAGLVLVMVGSGCQGWFLVGNVFWDCQMGVGNNFEICQWRVKTPEWARSRLIFGRLMMWHGEENRWVLPRVWKSAGADVRFWWNGRGGAGKRRWVAGMKWG